MKTKLISKRKIKTSEDMLTLRLPAKLMKLITLCAKANNVSRSTLVRDILQFAIDNK